MNRKEITKLLTDTLIRTRLSDRKYFAREVTLDYGTNHPKRVDVMQYIPKGVTYASDIGKGDFICYEIKSCKADVYSGHGLRFYGEQNYIVTTMECYKELIKEDSRKLTNYIKDNYPESSTYYGIMVLVPAKIDLRDSAALYDEMQNPTPLSNDISWQLAITQNCRPGPRSRGTEELLFCMLRAKHSSTNYQDEV